MVYKRNMNHQWFHLFICSISSKVFITSHTKPIHNDLLIENDTWWCDNENELDAQKCMKVYIINGVSNYHLYFPQQLHKQTAEKMENICIYVIISLIIWRCHMSGYSSLMLLIHIKSPLRHQDQLWIVSV